MAEVNPPFVMNAAGVEHDARVFRNALTAILAQDSGVSRPGHLAVTATLPNSMSVNIAAGKAFINGTSQSNQGCYCVVNDANITVTLPAPNATNNRIDLIVAQIFDSEEDGGTSLNEWQIANITGTPSSSPVVPAIPASSIVLAEILVPHLPAAAIAPGNITDARPLVTPGVPTGSVHAFAGLAVPVGYMGARGQAVSRITYSELFGIIGTQHGIGDGAHTFNVPDLRGRAIVGQDLQGGTPANRITAAWADTIGGAGGDDTHILTATEMPDHSHVMANLYGDWSGTVGAAHGLLNNNTQAAAVATPYATAVGGGGNAPHSIVQPSMALMMVIKF